jgi:hypothetical protein
MQRTQVRSAQLSDLPIIIEDYIYRGIECEHMSLYEMMMKTEVRSMTSTKWAKYVSQTNGVRIRSGRQFNPKARFLPQHSKADTHWISFHSNDKTPVIYGKISTAEITTHN